MQSKLLIKLRWVLWVLVIVVVLMKMLISFNPANHKEFSKTNHLNLSTKPFMSKNSTVNSLGMGGQFILKDHEGNVFDGVQSGKYKLIYFGFSSCPHICPTNLAFMSEIIEDTANIHDKYLPLFITIDPDRDTIERLNEYHKNFNHKILMLTGDKENLNQVADNMRVFRKVLAENVAVETGGFDHSSLIYFVGPDNHYITHFTTADKIERVTSIINQYVGGDSNAE